MNLFAGLFSALGSGFSTVAVTALLALAIFGGGYFKGSGDARLKADRAVAEAHLAIALAYAGEIVASQNKADDLAAENSALRAAQAPKDRIITKEIVRYEIVTPPGLRAVLPGTWRLRHDAAATGQPTAAEAGPLDADAAAPVTDVAALATVGANYETCRDEAAKVEAWQRRYHRLEAPQ